MFPSISLSYNSRHAAGATLSFHGNNNKSFAAAYSGKPVRLSFLGGGPGRNFSL